MNYMDKFLKYLTRKARTTVAVGIATTKYLTPKRLRQVQDPKFCQPSACLIETIFCNDAATYAMELPTSNAVTVEAVFKKVSRTCDPLYFALTMAARRSARNFASIFVDVALSYAFVPNVVAFVAL